ncbi:MAG: DUF2281 domain-containing protein [Anaerolineae bacterium]
MNVAGITLRDAIIKTLDELPSEQVAEVLDFVLFLKQRAQAERREPQPRVVKTVPAGHLDAVIGFVAWGGDALADTERLYEV